MEGKETQMHADALRPVGAHAACFEGRPKTQHRRMLDRWGWKPKRGIGPGMIYFILSPTMNRMKIGCTINSFEKRFSTLQTGSPDILIPLQVIYVSDIVLEEKLHWHAKDHNTHGEWFRFPDCIADVCAGLTSWKGGIEVMRVGAAREARDLASAAKSCASKRKETA